MARRKGRILPLVGNSKDLEGVQENVEQHEGDGEIRQEMNNSPSKADGIFGGDFERIDAEI